MVVIEKDLSNKISNFSFICSLLVVGVHVGASASAVGSINFFNDIMHDYFCAIAVPFFFVCSGFFLAAHYAEPGWYQRELFKRCFTILLPYILWSFLSVILCYSLIMISNMLHGKFIFSGLPTTTEFWLRSFGLYLYDYPSFIHLWYLRALMIIVLISPIIMFLCRKVSFWFCILAGIVVLVFDHGKFSNEVRLFFSSFVSLKGIFYFSIGAWLRIHGVRIVSFSNRLGCLAILASLMFLLLLSGQISKHLFILFFMVGAFTLTPVKPFHRFFNRFSFQIYLIHLPLLVIISTLVPIEITNVYLWLTKWFIGCVGALLCAHCIKHFAPGCYRYLFGGR